MTAYYAVDYVKNVKGTNYWMNRVMKVAAEFPADNLAVANLETAAALIDEKDVATTGYFPDQTTHAAKAFLAVDSNMDDSQFALSSSANFGAEHKLEGEDVLLLKTFDDGPSVLPEGITEEAVTTFVPSEYLPLVVVFNQDTAQKIFSGEIKSHLLSFLSPKPETHETDVGIMKAMAVENRGKMLLVIITIDEEDHKRILEFFGITDSELPTFRTIQRGEDMAMLKPDATVKEAVALVAGKDVATIGYFPVQTTGGWP